MMLRAQELCRKLKPVLGAKIDGIWRAYLADANLDSRADLERTLELLAAKHLGTTYEPDRAPFPPPSKEFANRGNIPIGAVRYGSRDLYPFHLTSGRLKEHILIAGRSGSGKTNLAFVLMDGIIRRGIKVLALDWKRAYRDLLQQHPELRVFTIGRAISPLRFNPLIPPPGCEINVWIKLIVDVIASSYLGGEGVISLLVAGLDRLYRDLTEQGRWPTIMDLLAWLRQTKLKGRAAMWQASAERILLAMTYGEFGTVVDTQDNRHVLELLDHNVVIEMDGLSSSSDRVMFSEALTLYLYRYRLAQGPRDKLTNMIILEEAHNLLHTKQAGTRESVLETSIRMIRQYGLGYVFVDQSASLLSKVAFANSYATLALSQKLRADIQVMSGAMNLTEEQRDSLNTLPVGSVVVRLADEHPEPFLVRVPRSPVREGLISDGDVRRQMAGYLSESGADKAPERESTPILAVTASDNKESSNRESLESHPPSPRESTWQNNRSSSVDSTIIPPPMPISRDAIRFLTDVATRPLSTTVSRYERLHLSRRRGNAVRRDLQSAGLISPVAIATRSGQVVLYELTDDGRAVCNTHHIDVPPRLRVSLEHLYWANAVARQFEQQGYGTKREVPVPGDGFVDVVAERSGERVAIEIETGKSDIRANIEKLRDAEFDRVILMATSPAAAAACQRVVEDTGAGHVEFMTWLDVT